MLTLTPPDYKPPVLSESSRTLFSLMLQGLQERLQSHQQEKLAPGFVCADDLFEPVLIKEIEFLTNVLKVQEWE